MPDSSDSSEPKKKRRFWEVDANIYVLSSKLGYRQRLLELARAVGKYVLWGLILSYPFTMPLIGVLFGGLVFWVAFGGSGLAIVVLLSSLGFPRISTLERVL